MNMDYLEDIIDAEKTQDDRSEWGNNLPNGFNSVVQKQCNWKVLFQTMLSFDSVMETQVFIT